MNLGSLPKRTLTSFWTDRHCSDFEDIKSELGKALILAYPDWGKTFVTQNR